MADTKDLKANRIKAYEYIKNTLHRPPCNIPLDISDAQLAKVLGGTIELEDSLRLLREGEHNPTNRLVTAFRNLVKGLEADSEIDAYLDKPFRDC